MVSFAIDMTLERALLFGVATLLCLAGAPRAQTPVEVAMPDGVIVWSAARPLAWEDFRGMPPRRLDGAQSALGYGYAIGCRSGVLRSRIVTYFAPARSWVVHRISSSGLASRVGIRHEQTHFDLKEVFARRARKRLLELTDPSTRSDDALNTIAETVFKAERAEQDRYDVRTGNGEDLDQQEEWARRVAADLAALKDFADPVR